MFVHQLEYSRSLLGRYDILEVGGTGTEAVDKFGTLAGVEHNVAAVCWVESAGVCTGDVYVPGLGVGVVVEGFVWAFVDVTVVVFVGVAVVVFVGLVVVVFGMMFVGVFGKVSVWVFGRVFVGVFGRLFVGVLCKVFVGVFGRVVVGVFGRGCYYCGVGGSCFL